MIGKDIVATANIFCSEHGLSADDAYKAIETALAISAKKDYDSTGRIDLICEIDRKSGSYSIFRKWTVVDDNEKNFDSERHLYDDQAEDKYEKSVEIGDVFTEFLSKDKPLSRISAQVFKNTMKEQLRMAIKLNAQEKFIDKVNDVFKVTVSRFSKGDIIVSVDDTVEGVIKKSLLQRKDRVNIGQVLDAVLIDVVENYKGQQLIFDRNSDAFIKAIVTNEIPDIQEGLIDIKAFARDRNKKTIVAVSTSATNTDPVATCIGVKGSRVKNIRNIVGGEAIEFVLWSEDTEEYFSNLFGRKAKFIAIDEEAKTVDVGMNQKNFDNIRDIRFEEKMFKKLSGFNVRIYTEEEYQNKLNTIAKYFVSMYEEKLMIDQDLAEVLVSEGFESFEVLAYTSLDDYLEIDGFDEDLANEIKSRAREVITESEKATQLTELKNLYPSIVEELNKKDIFTIEDLACLSVDELKEDFLDLRSREIENIIKEAKNIYFK